MPFAFAYESLLRLRRSQQGQQELRVQQANERVRQVVRELHNLDTKIAEVSFSHRPEDLRAAELQFNESRCRVLEERRRQARIRLAELRDLQAAAVRQLRTAWQQREVLETLRRQRWRAYVLDQQRREQRALDDLYLSRQRRTSTF